MSNYAPLREDDCHDWADVLRPSLTGDAHPAGKNRYGTDKQSKFVSEGGSNGVSASPVILASFMFVMWMWEYPHRGGEDLVDDAIDQTISTFKWILHMLGSALFCLV